MPSFNGDPSKSTPANGEPQANGSPYLLGGSEMESHAGGPASSLSMAGLLKGLRRRWLLAFSLGFVCATGGAAAAWYYLPPGKSTAQALLHVDSAPKSLVFQDHQARAAFQIYQKTQIALVKTRLVLNAALRNEDVAKLSKIRELEARGGDQALEWLERELQVDFSIGPEILRIAMTGDQPEDLKVIVDAVKDAYLKEIPEKEKKSQKERLEQIKVLYRTWENNVQTKREEMGKNAEELNTTDSTAIAAIRKFDEEFLSLTRAELLKTRSEIRRLKAIGPPAGHLSAPSIKVVSERTIDEYLRNDLDWQALLVRKKKIEADMHAAAPKLTGGESHPFMQKYKNELKDVEDEMSKVREKIRPQINQELQQKSRADQQASNAAWQDQIAEFERLEKDLHDSMAKMEKNIVQKGKDSLKIETSKDQLQLAQEILKRLANQKEALSLELDAPYQINELEKAYITHPDEAKRKLVAVASAGGGAFGLVLFVVSWWEFRRQRINSVDEVVQGLGIRLMGTVPALPSRRQLRMISGNGAPDYRWQNILTESVDTARTMLLHMARSESLRVVMVTSATGGEGKTSLSSHLAASLARAGRKTLLLDADLRNPAIHRLFGIQRSPGLCELLRGEVAVADTIQATPAPGLSLIPAGRCDNLALQALAQDNFQRICEQVRAEYDFVVVDSAPVLPVADSLLVGQHVDAVIFSILHDVSRLPKVYAAHQRLAMLGIRMLGAVVSGTHVDSYGPDYQYVGQVETSVDEEA
jgi:polysaccharide biosynthesis transport protein